MNSDRMSLKSSFNDGFPLERPGIQGQLPHHADPFRRSRPGKVVLISLILEGRPADDLPRGMIRPLFLHREPPRFKVHRQAHARIALTTLPFTSVRRKSRPWKLVGQPLVVDAQEVEHRGVEVVDGDDVLDGARSRVRRSCRGVMPPLMPPPASHIEKPLMWWSRPLPWAIGVRPNSPPQTIRVSSSIPRCFRSVIRAAAGLVDLLGLELDVVLDAAVVVPVAVVELDEAHAALGQAAGQQAVRGERAVGALGAVQLQDVLAGSPERSIRPGTLACIGRPSRTG